MAGHLPHLVDLRTFLEKTRFVNYIVVGSGKGPRIRSAFSPSPNWALPLVPPLSMTGPGLPFQAADPGLTQPAPQIQVTKLGTHHNREHGRAISPPMFAGNCATTLGGFCRGVRAAFRSRPLRAELAPRPSGRDRAIPTGFGQAAKATFRSPEKK